MIQNSKFNFQNMQWFPPTTAISESKQTVMTDYNQEQPVTNKKKSTEKPKHQWMTQD